MGVAMGAVGQPGEGGAHAEPAEGANELADFLVSEEKVPLTEENSPITDVTVDEREGLGAGVLHVGADLEEIFEKPESGEGEAAGLTVEIEVDPAKQRDEKLAERAAEKHQSVAAPGEEKMARFVDHEIDEIGKEEAGGIAGGVEEEERIGEEPKDAGVAGDGVPGLGFGERERHGNRLTTAGCELRER